MKKNISFVCFGLTKYLSEKTHRGQVAVPSHFARFSEVTKSDKFLTGWIDVTQPLKEP